MKINLPNDSESSRYDFQFYKKHIYKKTTDLELDTSGQISLQRKEADRFEDSLEYLFKSGKFIQKGVNDPLVFNPVKWIFNLPLNTTGIDEKDSLKLIWNRYRDKYRKQENLVAFKMLESLYFNVPLGMEYQAFSNTPYLVFFINLFEKDIEKDMIIKGVDWVLMPMSIPVNTTFQCVNLIDGKMELKGWISLDEEKMEMLISDKQFKETARSYHFSKNFSLDSQIKIVIDTQTSCLNHATFDLEINGEEEKLSETMKYEINRDISDIMRNYKPPTNYESCIIEEIQPPPKKAKGEDRWIIID